LNHKFGVIRGVASVYNRYSYAAEKREALERWGSKSAAKNWRQNLPAKSVID
jgi:hypothetical protein